jgi:hypothetical protein
VLGIGAPPGFSVRPFGRYEKRDTPLIIGFMTGKPKNQRRVSVYGLIIVLYAFSSLSGLDFREFLWAVLSPRGLG